jgi:serine/threonine protein kinase
MNHFFGKRQDIGTEQVMMKILDEVDLTKIDSVPEPFRTVLKKCLVKHAAKRVQAVDELIEIINSQLFQTRGKPLNVQKTPPGSSNERPTELFSSPHEVKNNNEPLTITDSSESNDQPKARQSNTIPRDFITVGIPLIFFFNCDDISAKLQVLQ